MKHISTIGCNIPSRCIDVNNLSLYSNASLSDTDILFFSPEDFYDPEEDTLSKEIQYRAEEYGDISRTIMHWQIELYNFLKQGGTFVVLLDSKVTFRLNKEMKATNYSLLNLYSDDEIVNLEGKFINSASSLFDNLLKILEDVIEYKVYIRNTNNEITPTFMTQRRDRILGGYYNIENGTVILLPYVNFNKEEFTYNDGIDDCWTEDAQNLGQTFIDEIIKISKQLKSGSDKTLPPEWSQSSLFNLEEAEQTKTKVKSNLDKINKLREENESLNEKLIEQEVLKGLLYETGKALEESVRKALRLLGYQAEGYDDGKLELDQVIVSPEEVKFIGECEGRDDKPIALKKFRQLLDSLKNYMYSGDEVKEVFGILIGNPYRLVNPTDRKEESFTPHCIDGAKREKIGLLTTESLFYVARYIQESNDIEFAKKCREAIFEQLGGVIVFPDIPSKEE